MNDGLPHVFPHGGGVEAAARRLGCALHELTDLSTGLHPDGAPTWLADWLSQHAELAAHYPDAQGEPARSALARSFGVKAEEVLIVAGAQAVIEVVIQAMGWQSLSLRVPCYHEPIRCARRVGCLIHSYYRGEPVPAADACWLISPSNPFGDAQTFPIGMPGLWDESYMAFAERRVKGVLPGVIRLGSLTKLFCIPGLRLGYVIAEAPIIGQLRHWLPPWPAGTLALHLLPVLLPEVDRRELAVVAARNRLAGLLRRYDWQAYPSEASFILARPPAGVGSCPASAHRLLLREFPEWPQLGRAVRFGLPGRVADWQRLEGFLADRPR